MLRGMDVRHAALLGVGLVLALALFLLYQTDLRRAQETEAAAARAETAAHNAEAAALRSEAAAAAAAVSEGSGEAWSTIAVQAAALAVTHAETCNEALDMQRKLLRAYLGLK